MPGVREEIHGAAQYGAVPVKKLLRIGRENPVVAPFMNKLFGSAPITLVLWRDDLAVGLAAYVIIEIEKWLHRKVGH